MNLLVETDNLFPTQNVNDLCHQRIDLANYAIPVQEFQNLQTNVATSKIEVGFLNAEGKVIVMLVIVMLPMMLLLFVQFYLLQK